MSIPQTLPVFRRGQRLIATTLTGNTIPCRYTRKQYGKVLVSINGAQFFVDHYQLRQS